MEGVEDIWFGERKVAGGREPGGGKPDGRRVREEGYADPGRTLTPTQGPGAQPRDVTCDTANTEQAGP